MKNITRLSLILSVFFIFFTSIETNALTQSQQGNTFLNFKYDYLPNHTVDSKVTKQLGEKLAFS